MATTADQRVLELLERWLESLELHTKYSSLDEDNYWKVQPWTEHQRPSRWIVDLAMQKTLALRSHVEARIKIGDARFSDALELMGFLANLVGSEHLERFIPMADRESEIKFSQASSTASPNASAPAQTAPASSAAQQRPAPNASGTSTSGTNKSPASTGSTPTLPTPILVPTLMPETTARAHRPAAHPRAAAVAESAARARAAVDAIAATREMPKFAAVKRAAPPASTTHVTRTERKSAVSAKHAGKSHGKPPAKGPAPERHELSDAARQQVMADAARLVQWGRRWFELPELIARMADRPSLPEVRRILKENKAAIEKLAGET